MKPIIPPELWVEIIDNLHDDKPTLCKCSLVCRLWLWSSRAHLFYTLALTPLDLDTSLSVLCAPGSTIPPHVRALQIEEAAFHEGGARRVINALPKLPQLSAVEKLSLSGFKWDFLTPEAKERLFTISRGLKSLRWHNMVVPTLGEALHLISSAPSLQCLYMGRMTWQSNDTSLTKFSAPPIKHIIFRWNSEIPAIIDWLCHWQPSPSVRNLTLHDINREAMPSITAYIRRLGPALEHLEVRCSNSYSGETQAALYKEIDLRQNTSLKTISIDNLILYHGTDRSHTYNWIIDVLSQITSRFLDRVTLVVSLRTPQELIPFNLPALAALFAHGNPTFSELSTRLQFGIYGAIDRTEARAAITESLPELHSQGRLEFGGGRITMSL